MGGYLIIEYKAITEDSKIDLPIYTIELLLVPSDILYQWPTQCGTLRDVSKEYLVVGDV